MNLRIAIQTLCFGLTILNSSHAAASDLTIEGALFHTDKHPHKEDPATRAFVEFWVEWKNAWRNERNHDSVWVFLKLRGMDSIGVPITRHATIVGEPEFLNVDDKVGSPRMEIRVSNDRTGFFIEPVRPYRGDVRVKIRAAIDPAGLEGFGIETLRASAYGIEMVYIPEGPFSAGAAGEAALEYGAYYLSTGDNAFGGPYRITNENEITVGPEAGMLSYRPELASVHMGDAEGPIPSAFPKGFNAYYMMKYELTQGQYANFLNDIDYFGADLRANFGGRTYYDDRGTIRREGNIYVADSPDRPANFVSWEDGIAFLDWAALRPMTDFEFDKAARGPHTPSADEYVWGTTSTSQVERFILRNGDVGMLNGASESELTDSTREQFAASYYWVMDLSGSLWERVVTIGDAAGRAFTGIHGDGDISAWGEATAAHWPRELGSPRSKKGFGYRGGGFYDEGGHYDLYRPHSPVAYRPFGNWSGGPRHRAYGFRGVRSANDK
ncbi:MAG: SUMF1/EgtB/PvdO family nonheme iron enzyme [Pseudomonadota bacterium]